MTTPTSFTFPKKEKLVSRTLIERLFAGASGSKAMSAFPLRMVYLLMNEEETHTAADADKRPAAQTQVLISVPKKYFKHAVDRNRVKRQVREAYRTNRHLFKVEEGKRLLIAFIWIDNQRHPSEEVTRKVVNLLRRLGERIAPRKQDKQEPVEETIDRMMTNE